MKWTLEGLDRVIAQAKANHRSAAYVAALERRRAALVAGERDAEQRKAAWEAASPTVDAWLEASMAVLEAAPGVGPEDADAIGQMLDILASWFPLVPEAEQEVGSFPGAEI